MTHKTYFKEPPIIYRGRAYHKFRRKVAAHANYRCYFCDGYAPFDSEALENGEVSHIKKRQFYGDTLENARWSHRGCHSKKHSGELSEQECI